MADFRFGSMTLEDQGSGPAVVMVHGLGGTSNSFQTLLPALSGYRVVRPDLPGAGRSPYRPGNRSLAGMAAALADALRAMEIRKAHFAGHSMGTLICQYLAVHRPEMVLSMTLLGAILEPPAAARDALKARATAVREQGMQAIADAVVAGATSASSRARHPAAAAFVRESLMRQDPNGYAAHCEALSEARMAAHSEIHCPALLIAGQDDAVAPVAMGQQLANRIANAKIQVISNAGHWIMLEAVSDSIDLLHNHIWQIQT